MDGLDAPLAVRTVCLARWLFGHGAAMGSGTVTRAPPLAVGLGATAGDCDRRALGDNEDVPSEVFTVFHHNI